MCGIAGIFRRDGQGVDTTSLKEMCSTLRHRGPDDDGFYFDEFVGLGMRRLSIIDLAGGHQPLFNEDRSLALVFNGEIYNYMELRRALVSRGHTFSTQTDGETILHLYEEKGLEALHDLNGMYAFCLWDSRRQEGYAVRDRLGIKPLYYHTSPTGDFFFASELKALAAAGVPLELDLHAIISYLSYGYIAGSRTPFKNIYKLPHGHVIRFSRTGVETPRRYWAIPAGPEVFLPEARMKEEFVHLVESSIELQSRSDVPVGVFLSGGIDSSLITAFYARKVKGRVLSFNVQYRGAPFDEGPYARQVAQAFGCEHNSVEVGWPDVLRDLPRLLWHMDEPHADSALAAVYRVSDLASHHVKVILNGTGGDELFGGYGRYCPNPWLLRAWHAVPDLLKVGVVPAFKFLGGVPQKAALNSRSDDTYLWGLQQFKPYQLNNFFSDRTEPPFREALVDALWAMAPPSDVNRRMYFDANFYLVDDLLLLLDKMTMAASIEGRVPLLDHRLVEWAFHLPGRSKVRGQDTKYQLRRWLEDLLPPEILRRQKQGFGAPVTQWMNEGMFSVATRLISGRPSTRASYYWGLRGADLEARMRSLSVQQNYALLILEIWLQVWMDELSPTEVTRRLETL